MNVDTLLVTIFSVIILFSAFRYEREDLGCESCFDTSVKACSDYNSVYVRGTKCVRNDTPQTINQKLKKLLSFDQAAGSWKRCVLWSFLIASLGYVMYARGGCIDGSNINKSWLFLISWIVFMAVLYAMKSFESTHIFRVIKENGHELCDKMYGYISTNKPT
jgi:hypothetical protein